MYSNIYILYNWTAWSCSFENQTCYIPHDKHNHYSYAHRCQCEVSYTQMNYAHLMVIIFNQTMAFISCGDMILPASGGELCISCGPSACFPPIIICPPVFKLIIFCKI